MTTLHTPTSRRTRRTVRSALAAAMGLALVLAGCSMPPAEAPPTGSASTVLSAHGLDGMDAEQIVNHLDALPLDERPQDLMASIRPTELLLTNGKDPDVTLPMPADKFYVSLSPYLEQTHECYFHSLTTCTGELFTQDMVVTVTNDATGEILVDGKRTTQANGFLGLWLPRDIKATVDVEFEGRSATASISTANDDDLTCLTTMQLV